MDAEVDNHPGGVIAHSPWLGDGSQRGLARRSGSVKMTRPLVRSLQRFRANPTSVRNAMGVIVVATCVATVIGALLVWFFDSKSFDSFGDALWWALQTVTTVGYGDVTPHGGIGRVIGGVVLIYSVAFLSILTAVITTSFVEQARRQRSDGEPSLQVVLDRLDDISRRLDGLENQGRFTHGE
jgi:voltage-gated potassium channel